MSLLTTGFTPDASHSRRMVHTAAYASHARSHHHKKQLENNKAACCKEQATEEVTLFE